ncbi:hypothetical protein ABZ464_03975 [Streptomyces sp. NPDC005820]|uniref:hypothetical protein n=1 Tax=Streptomyces sp. NPDC005820 TaxID=3157069 RepID=UPI0034096594
MFPADSPAAQAIAARRQEQHERIVQTLEAAVEAHELRALDAPSAARFLIASWAGVHSMEAQSGTPAEAAATLAAGVRSLIEGLATPNTVTDDRRLRPAYEAALQRHGLGPGLDSAP